MAPRMKKTNAQDETSRLVLLYNMGLISRGEVMARLGLPRDTTSKHFWNCRNREADEGMATWVVRLRGH